MKVTKIEIANRQISQAIKLIFWEYYDLIPIQTLIDAALGTISELYEASNLFPGRVTPNTEFFGIASIRIQKMRYESCLALSLVKPHLANEVDVDLSELLTKIFIATLDMRELCGDIDEMKSFYQLWFLAAEYPTLGVTKEDVQPSIDTIGPIHLLKRFEQFETGRLKMQALKIVF